MNVEISRRGFPEGAAATAATMLLVGVTPKGALSSAGTAAMTWLGDSEFDLLLADIVMPGVNGIDLAKHANSDFSKLKVMLITGFAAVALKAQGEVNLNAKVLSKPFHLNDLVDEVDKLFAA